MNFFRRQVGANEPIRPSILTHRLLDVVELGSQQHREHPQVSAIHHKISRNESTVIRLVSSFQRK